MNENMVVPRGKVSQSWRMKLLFFFCTFDYVFDEKSNFGILSVMCAILNSFVTDNFCAFSKLETGCNKLQFVAGCRHGSVAETRGSVVNCTLGCYVCNYIV